jgi:predicted site-specific integrase-resolvase
MSEKEKRIMLSDALSVPMASEIYGISVDIIKRHAREGKFLPTEAVKRGKNWIITRQGMERVFGAPSGDDTVKKEKEE